MRLVLCFRVQAVNKMIAQYEQLLGEHQRVLEADNARVRPVFLLLHELSFSCLLPLPAAADLCRDLSAAFARSLPCC